MLTNVQRVNSMLSIDQTEDDSSLSSKLYTNASNSTKDD